MPGEDLYSLADLADLAGVSPRTVRYYIAQGLLPGPEQVGRGASYGDAHLARLRLIRRLSGEHLPLAEIRVRLARLSDREVLALAPVEEAETPPPDSALDYIRAVLEDGRPASGAPQGPVPMLVPAARSFAASTAPSTAALPQPAGSPLPTATARPLADTVAESPSQTSETSEALPTTSRSQWDRISLTPDLELHVRRPLTRQQNKFVERLLAIVRELLKEA